MPIKYSGEAEGLRDFLLFVWGINETTYKSTQQEYVTQNIY